MIAQGDCLELIKEIADNTVDLIATDPPYCVGASSNGKKSSFSDFNLMRPFWEECFSQWRRVLKDGGHVYVCTDWRTYPFLYPLLIKYFDVRNLIVWDFGWMKAGAYYRPTHELIMFATLGKTGRIVPRTEPDVWRLKCVNYTKERLHPAQKPVELFSRMISNSTQAGELVLDPFLGAGTCGVAALELGRDFIGYEIDEKYFKVAQERLHSAQISAGM